MRLNARAFVWLSSSVAVTVKLNVVLDVKFTFGVPVSCPFAEPKETPVGNAPEVTEYASVPPSGSAATIVIVDIATSSATEPTLPAAVVNDGVPLYEIPFVDVAVNPLEFVTTTS